MEIKERTESKITPKHPPLTKTEAILESSRCLNCFDAPCTIACPTAINVPQFIKRIQDGNLPGSADTILESNILGLSCARVCPVEELCVGQCVYNQMDQKPIQIGRLQQHAMERFYKNPKLKTPSTMTAHKVALIGAGPASLSCAAYLALSGVKPVIFEKSALPGGLNATGVAPYKFKLEDNLLEVQFIQSLGVEIKTNHAVDQNAIADLQHDYNAIFLGVGLGSDNFALDPTDTPGAIGSLELIEAIKTQKTTLLDNVQNALIIGGGNTALDVAQELPKLNIPRVTMAYRKSRAEMSGYKHELDGALLEGVTVAEHHAPERFIKNQTGRAVGVEFSTPQGARRIEADLTIFATGQKKQPLRDWFPDLQLDAKGNVAIDSQSCETSVKDVYAGGDCVNGGREVVFAVAHGRQAAFHILKKLNVEVKYGRFSD